MAKLVRKWRLKLNALAHAGNRHFHTEAQIKRNTIANQILLFFMAKFVVVVVGVIVVNLIFFLVPRIGDQMQGDKLLLALYYAVPALIMMVVFGVIFVVRARTGSIWPWVLSLVLGQLFVSYYCLMLGLNTGFYLYFLVILQIPFFAIGPENKKAIWWSEFIFAITALTVVWIAKNHKPWFPVPPSIEQGLYYTLFFFSILGVVFCCYYLWSQTYRTENQLIAAREELETAYEQLSARDNIMQLELDIASRIQEAMSPDSDATLGGLRYLVSSRPVGKVSGDYYDVFKVGDSVFFLMADISGHGVPAALVSMLVRQTFSDEIKASYKPSRIYKAVNNSLVERIKSDDYLTAFLLKLEGNTLRFGNAGHNKAIHYKAKSDEFTSLDTPGLPLGNLSEASDSYQDGKVLLEEGDRIFLFTDGIIEQRNPEGAEFTLQRLLDFLATNRQQSLEAIHKGLVTDWESFARHTPQADDITLFSMEFNTSQN